MTDAILRQVTDRDFISPRIDRMPVFKRFLQTDLGGGLQQQYYELRAESNKFQQTVNALRKQGRTDELMAYMQNHRGLAVTRPQILAIERYMRHWRKQRDAVLNTNSLSSDQKEEILEQMERSRDMRLAYVPELREQSDIPLVTLGL
jgi:predicted P-loop ATPase/GTPase